jgi:hypothetical protein
MGSSTTASVLPGASAATAHQASSRIPTPARAERSGGSLAAPREWACTANPSGTRPHRSRSHLLAPAPCFPLMPVQASR